MLFTHTVKRLEMKHLTLDFTPSPQEAEKVQKVLFAFAVYVILLAMEVREEVLSDHASAFEWHLAKNLAFPLLFSRIPPEQGGHRFDWEELLF